MFTVSELKKIPILECLTPLQLEWLASIAADVQVRKDEWLLREGDTPWFFILYEGEVEVRKEFGTRNLEVAHYKSGDFFGEVPILLHAPSLASVRGFAEVSRMARLDPMQFKAFLDQSEKCRAAILKVMTSRLNRITDYVGSNNLSRVLVVGSQYDNDCRDIRSFLSLNRVPYDWVDREREPQRVPACMPLDHKGPAVVIDQNQCLGESPTVRTVADALGFRTNPEHEDYDVVVIGGGPAGLAAGVYGASEGLDVLIVERYAAGGQAGTSTRIENYLGFPNGISGDELSQRALRQAQRFEAEIVLTRQAENVEQLTGGGYCVELDGGTRVRSKTVILANGVDWRRLDAKGIERLQGKGVLYGASRTEAPTVSGKDVFIVGGGNSAGQAAMFFASYARSITMLVRGEGLRITMSKYLIEELARKDNVTVEPWTQIVSVNGEDRLETITTVTRGAEPVTRKADALFIMIGADANTIWLPKNLQRDERGYICTGRDVSDLPGWDSTKRPPFLLETNLPGFFCAGDVRHDSIKRVSSSVGEGSMAIAFIHQYLALGQAGEFA